MDLQDVVNANQHRFSETEREILAFMLENEEFVAESTINSLAHKTYQLKEAYCTFVSRFGRVFLLEKFPKQNNNGGEHTNE